MLAVRQKKQQSLDLPGWAAASLFLHVFQQSLSQKKYRGGNELRGAVAHLPCALWLLGNGGSSPLPLRPFARRLGDQVAAQSVSQHVWPLNGMGRVRAIWKDRKCKSEVKAL